MKTRLSNWTVLIGLSIVNLVTVSAAPPEADAPQPPRLTLMGSLSEWLYPGSKPRGEATMSDGGNPLLQSIKCTAVLTTADPLEKVVDFYTARFEKPQRLEDGKVVVTPADARSVTTLDDSDGRPLVLRVIVVTQADTVTTLVISRAKGEESTHIAWTQYRVLRRNAS